MESDCGSNWFLRLSNLRKIYQNIVDFYVEVLERDIPSKLQPDLDEIARDRNMKQLGNLLQLLLGCAINCANKEKHIEVMTQLSLEVKHVLKAAIDDLESLDDNVNSGESSFMLNMNNSPSLNITKYVNENIKLKEELNNVTVLKNEVLQKLAETETVLDKIKEEKRVLLNENDQLKNSCKESTLRFDSIEHENLFQRLNNQIIQLQSELSQMEEQKEDLKINLDIKEKEYHKVLLQSEQLQSKVNEFKNDRDELDRLKYLHEEFIKYKSINEAQKKKLEAFQDLKKQIKQLEDRNSSLVKQICELEEDKKSVSVFKGQLDLIKKQRDDLRTKANEESFRADKAENELQRLHKKFSEIQQENDKQKRELEKMKSQGIKTSPIPGNSIDVDMSNGQTRINSSFKESIIDNTELNEKLARLEYENSKLKNELKESNDEKVVLLSSQLDDERLRINKLEAENKFNVQRIIDLEGQISENKSTPSSSSRNDNEGEISFIKSKLIEAEAANVSLKALLEKKNMELAMKEERFKQHVNKAKQTFDLLETHMNNSKISNSLPDTSKVQTDDVCYWKNMAQQKEQQLEHLRREMDKAAAVHDIEGRYMSLNFHNLVIHFHDSFGVL